MDPQRIFIATSYTKSASELLDSIVDCLLYWTETEYCEILGEGEIKDTLASTITDEIYQEFINLSLDTLMDQLSKRKTVGGAWEETQTELGKWCIKRIVPMLEFQALLLAHI